MKTAYQRMLDDRYYLYRPWIPICKSIEAEVIGGLKLEEPVLDIGCGTGLFGKYCFKKKIAVGLDCDENALREARAQGVYDVLEAGDACALPFSEGSFKTVLSVCAVEHIHGLDKVLECARNVLKSGGKFIFTVPSTQFGWSLFGSRLFMLTGMKERARLYGEKKNKRSGHLHVYEAEKWKELLVNNGFGHISIDYIFPPEAVFLWSFFHSLPFKIIFLPFRAFRNLNIKFVDNLLNGLLNKLLAEWMSEKSKIQKEKGGYLLIQAAKP